MLTYTILFIVACLVLGLSIWALVSKCKNSKFGVPNGPPINGKPPCKYNDESCKCACDFDDGGDGTTINYNLPIDECKNAPREIERRDVKCEWTGPYPPPPN